MSDDNVIYCVPGMDVAKAARKLARVLDAEHRRAFHAALDKQPAFAPQPPCPRCGDTMCYRRDYATYCPLCAARQG